MAEVQQRSRTEEMHDKIKELVLPVCEAHYSIDYVILFGSRARGDFTSSSDVDLLVSFVNDELPANSELFAIYDELREALGLELDFIPYKQQKLGPIGHAIARDGVCVYVRPCKR